MIEPSPGTLDPAPGRARADAFRLPASMSGAVVLVPSVPDSAPVDEILSIASAEAAALTGGRRQ